MKRDRRGDQEPPKVGAPKAGAAVVVGKTTLRESLSASEAGPSSGEPAPARQTRIDDLPVQRKATGGIPWASKAEPHSLHTIASLFGGPASAGSGKREDSPAAAVPTAAAGGSPVRHKATEDTGFATQDGRALPEIANRGGGRSSALILDQVSGGGHRGAAVQRTLAASKSGGTSHGPRVASPKAGIDKTGFIDNSTGAPIYSGPAEAGGEVVRDAPLPPGSRVFVSGTHPRLSHWWYVTAYLEHTMVRGFVEDFRVNTEPPEPLAELRQLVGGETAEGLAKEKFGSAVTDGHDLRYYENVLLYVNRGRAGITGTYQDPGILGGGGNNIQLVAGHRIWLVSADYAKALQSVVPSGSLTGGAVAKVKRFVGHIEDILRSVTESRHHLDQVAGEYAQAIRDHMAPIVGIVAGFIAAEAVSAFLAATPTGVGQAIAMVIQLALSAFGAAGMVEAGAQALEHGSAWLTTAWTAKGNEAKIVAASKEFLKMLVAIAMAALSFLGARGNYRNLVKIGGSTPIGGLPALATAGSGTTGGAGAATGVAIGPGTGAIGVAGAQMVKHEGEGDKSEHAEPAANKEPPGAEVEAEAEFTAKLEKNVANEAHGTAERARKPLDLGNEWAQVQAGSEKVYRDTFHNEYVKARAGGEAEIPAKNLAREAARKATKAHVKSEGVRIAKDRAQADILKDTNRDGVPDAFKNADSKAVRDFTDFRTGARGGMAKRLSAELPGKTVDEMEALLQKARGTRNPGERGTFSMVKEGQNSYPQASYHFSDGTLVRIKPQGDIKNGTQPIYSVEVESGVAASGARPQENVAFKMESSGEPVPKGPDDVNNPYSTKQPEQRKAYEQEMIRLGHRQAKKQD